jgi:hypothetical protein
MSSVASRHGLSISSLLRKLKQPLYEMRSTEGKGEREILYGQKEMSQLAEKISTKLDLAEEIEPHILALIESALEKSDDFAKRVMKVGPVIKRRKGGQSHCIGQAQNVL